MHKKKHLLRKKKTSKKYKILIGKWCPYCNCETELTTRKELFGDDKHPDQLFIRCKNNKSHYARVYCGENGTPYSIGIIADKELRYWQKKAQEVFDELWQQVKVKTRMRKFDVLQKLTAEMNIDRVIDSIEKFNIAQCKRILELSREFLEGKRNSNLYNIDDQRKETRLEFAVRYSTFEMVFKQPKITEERNFRKFDKLIKRYGFSNDSPGFFYDYYKSNDLDETLYLVIGKDVFSLSHRITFLEHKCYFLKYPCSSRELEKFLKLPKFYVKTKKTRRKDNPLTVKWWHQLKKELKDQLLFNIELARYKPVGAHYDFSKTKEENFKKITGKDYVKKEYHPKEIVKKAYALKVYYDYSQADALRNFYFPLFKDLKPISDLANLEKIYLHGNAFRNGENEKSQNSISPREEEKLRQIGCFSKLKKLKYLYIQDNDFFLEEIAKLTELQVLDIKGCYNSNAHTGNIQDLTPLTKLKKLHTLNLAGNEAVLDPLGKMRSLRKLDLSGNFQDLSPLSNLIWLEELILKREYGGPGNLQDLSFLKHLKRLRSLEMASNKKELSALSHLKKLRFLNLAGNAQDLKPLASLKNLRRLYLGYNAAELDPLENLINLKYLDLTLNFKALDFLKGLQNLRFLNLPANTRDLQPLSTLENLKALNLYDNKQDLSSLANLKNLEAISLRKNTADLTPIKDLPNLKKLYLQHNSADLTPILGLIKRIRENGGMVMTKDR